MSRYDATEWSIIVLAGLLVVAICTGIWCVGTIDNPGRDCDCIAVRCVHMEAGSEFTPADLPELVIPKDCPVSQP